jgi:tetratricopeptide (TPR) repeat protein
VKKKQDKSNTYFDLIGWVIIIVLGFIIYSNSFGCSFHLDDFHNIVENNSIRDLGDVKAWWNFYPTRPLGILTFALNYHFNQLDVRYWHVVNLVIHLINACLVRWLVLSIFSSPALKEIPVIRYKNSIALLTALLFVSHPLATQSVTYIVQRMSSMVAMFYLLSLGLYAEARLTNKSHRFTIFLFAGSFISAVFAMLTKENAFTLPFAILLLEFSFLRTKKLSINFRDWRLILLMAAFLGVLLIIPLKYPFSILKPISPTQGNTYTLTPLNYLFTQFSVIVKYIRLLFLPVNQNADYDFPVSNNFFDIRTLLSFLVLLSLFLSGVFLYQRNRILSFGIFWFFLTLSIESSFIPINDVIFEHRTYLPSFGFFLILSTGICQLLSNKNKYLPVSLLILIIGFYSFLTYQRNKVWKDELSLWNDVISNPPVKARPYYNRGVVYTERGEWENAISDYTKAIGVNPAYLYAYNNRGNAYGKTGRWDLALTDCSRMIGLDPKYATAWYNRGFAYSNLGQWDKAISDYSKVIGLDPENKDAYINRGYSYANLGQWERAINDYSMAIGIDPNNIKVYANRGDAYGNLGHWERAINDYARMIRIDPKYATAWYNHGLACSNLRQWDTAIADYTRAIELDPEYKDAYNNRGLTYANLGQWEKAINDYSKVIGLDPKNRDAYNNREVAYKRSGIRKKP